VKQKVCSSTLHLEIQEAAGFPSIKLHGEGEHRGAEQLKEAVDELIRSGRTEVMIDARNLTFLDPESAEVLSAAMEQLEEQGGAMVIVDHTQPVERALRLLGLEQLVHVVRTPEQAARYLSC
jgi:anti-anti-sigma factor